MTLPTNLIKASEALGETNDCSVKALSVALGVSYDVAHSALRARGRKERRGVQMRAIHGAAADLGYKLVPVTLPWVKRCKTAITLAANLPSRGRFLVDMPRHVAGCAAGKVLDWTEGRRKRVVTIYRPVKL